MDNKPILIVDDESDLCEILQVNLMAEGYEVDVAYSADEAMKKDLNLYRLILLDVMMPGMSGFQMARLLRAQGNATPIIFLTARDSEEDRLQGFSLGADDYISKPFSVRELTARVKAVLSRSEKAMVKNDTTLSLGSLLTFNGLTINLSQMSASADGEPLNLTKTELNLLILLLKQRGQVFSRQQLLDEVWSKDVVVTERTVDVNITRLRKKLGHYGQYIITRQGYGYLFRWGE